MIVLALLAFAAAEPRPFVPTQIGGLIDGRRFQGGIYDGLSVGNVVTPDGKSFRGLLPSLPGAAPVNGAEKQAIESYISGVANPSAPTVARFLKPGLIIENCRQKNGDCDNDVLMPVLFGEPLRANAPYKLGDGSVRVEWLYGDALYYLTFLRVAKGVITYARTQPAWLPTTGGAH